MCGGCQLIEPIFYILYVWVDHERLSFCRFRKVARTFGVWGLPIISQLAPATRSTLSLVHLTDLTDGRC